MADDSALLLAMQKGFHSKMAFWRVLKTKCTDTVQKYSESVFFAHYIRESTFFATAWLAYSRGLISKLWE